MSHRDDHRIRRNSRADGIAGTWEETEESVGAEPNADARYFDRSVHDARELTHALQIPAELRIRHALLQPHAAQQRGVARSSLHPRQLRIDLEERHRMCAVTIGALEPVQRQRSIA